MGNWLAVGVAIGVGIGVATGQHHDLDSHWRRPRRRAERGGSKEEGVVRAIVVTLLLAVPCAAAGQTIEGRWKLLAAEDLRADGSVARHPWGRNPIGSIVVDRGWCYVQIMSGDVPSFAAGATPIGEQMSAALLSSYIAYAGACTIDEKEGSVTLKVDAAWRPNYVGTTQKRFFRFEGANKMLFGPAPNSMKSEGGPLTRRLTLERQP